MGDFYSSEEIRSIIINAHKIKEHNKCHECNGTGFLNWDGEVGGDVKPGRLTEYDDVRIDGMCQKCDGIGYLDITMYEE